MAVSYVWLALHHLLVKWTSYVSTRHSHVQPSNIDVDGMNNEYDSGIVSSLRN
jgi:hypothetical protein